MNESDLDKPANRVQSFEDLKVWQRSIDLSVHIYGLTKSFPKEEVFGLTSQLRRASVSISSNIAEGQARRTSGEFIQFLCIARGSNAEVRSQLTLVSRLNLGDPVLIDRCRDLTNEISRMLNGLLSTLRIAKSPNR